MKLAIPDIASRANFPVVAAQELGFFKAEALNIELVVFPLADACYRALHDGEIELVAAPAHSGLSVFRNWNGLKFLCAQAQGMHLVLVVHKRFDIQPGDLKKLGGLRVGTSSWDMMPLRQVLIHCGIDDVKILPIPIGKSEGSLSVSAAIALAENRVDGIWADAMAAQIAVANGTAKVVFDVRHRSGPKEAFNFTAPVVSATERLMADSPGVAASIVRAVVKTHKALRADPRASLAVGQKLFPEQARYIEALVRQDSLFYDAALSRKFIIGLTRCAEAEGLVDADVSYEQIVATQLSPLWGMAISRSNRQNRTGGFGG